MTAAGTQFIGRPDPPVTPETRGWWDATRERRLTVQRCRGCGYVQLYPRAICTSCGSLELTLAPASGRGTVYSHSTVYTSPNPAMFTPTYVVALVRLDEGPIVLTNLVGPGAARATCDSGVAVVWEALADGRHLPLFTPVVQEQET